MKIRIPIKMSRNTVVTSEYLPWAQSRVHCTPINNVMPDNKIDYCLIASYFFFKLQ